MIHDASRNVILVMGDQLSAQLSSLREADKSRDIVLMTEVLDEAQYVRHHRKKLAFVFSAMRHFADELRADGWEVCYRSLAEPDNRGSFTGELDRAVEIYSPARVVVTEPGEWRVLQLLKVLQRRSNCSIDILPDDRFICSTSEFATWAEGRKELRMEFFYRELRKHTGLLMDGETPAGGQWNYDRDNRKPAKRDLLMPRPLRFPPDKTTDTVLELVSARFSDHFGTLRPFHFAVTRHDAEAAFDHFVEHALPLFGDYQDAMLAGEAYLYHSVISIYLNAGLLDALTLCRTVERGYRAGKVPLNSAEGFIRQVLGWREYVRGIYWLKMPAYAESNAFEHGRPLPDFYWTGETPMRCMSEAISQSRHEAYAHHIQRLMVTGNFALLAGIRPHAVHEWYLSVYADAYEWVELPNTLGMSQFADGGLMASKPYISSGAYINRMSDYCGSCRYDVNDRSGPNACPFNYLYWNFLATHRRKLSSNRRMAQMYRLFDNLSTDDKAEIKARARAFLDDLRPSTVWP
ncbi:MAG: cryptochrome/photolyase family protein [Hyphomicrobiaceae bacterium]|nr:cryptochrome/photolyase family protein [Hyphomicrobiaceae bacterium]